MSAHTTGRPHPSSGRSPRGHNHAAPAIPVSSVDLRATARSVRWWRTAQRVGRFGVLVIPVYAILAGVLPRASRAFSTDPAAYHRYFAARYRPLEVVAGLGTGLSCVLSAAFLAMLLLRGRGRRYGLVGLGLALAGAVGLLVVTGGVVIRADRLRTPLFHLDWARIDVNAHTMSSAAAVVVVCSAVALTAGWLLLGVGLLRTRGANKGDGVLLMISAPLLYLGGMALRVLPTMGSFILLAAGLGIVVTGGRMVAAADGAGRPLRRRRPAPMPQMPAILVPDRPDPPPRRRRGRE
ncbi:MAG TPA: hypothetical protein VKB69_11030 [Micromonosporaceae bacterium]|nr:hypothetical protein [Micromonosporaceae bacterium]